MQLMPKMGEGSAFGGFPFRLVALGVAISILEQMTGVPIIREKQCIIYQSPDNEILEGSLKWGGERQEDCEFDGE